MAKAPHDSIVPPGVTASSPFNDGQVAIVTNSAPPEVGGSVLSQVVVGGFTGFAFTNGGGFFSDGGGANGITVQSEVGGSGVYLSDFSGVGIYLEDFGGSGVYIIANADHPSNDGIYLIQEAADSAGIFLQDEATSGTSVVNIETANAPIILKPKGAQGFILLNPATVTRFGTLAGTALAEVGPLSFVMGTNYATLAPYLVAGDSMAVFERMALYRASNTPNLQQRRTGGTLALPTAVTNGMGIGVNSYEGWDGTAFFRAASIEGTASAAWGAADHGATIRLRVTPNGTTVLRDGLVIQGTGEVQIPAPSNNVHTLLLTAFGGAGNPVIRINAATNGAAAQVGTLANAPVAGNPGFWIPISIAGTVRYIPCW